MPVENILYTAHATSTGGREGRTQTPDRVLDVGLTMPRELGGNGAAGSNPEQLFAAGYSACFLGALNFVASKKKLKLHEKSSVEGAVGIGPIATGFGIAVELKISLPGLERAQAEELVSQAHIVCPYSNATQGNINVTLTIL